MVTLWQVSLAYDNRFASRKRISWDFLDFDELSMRQNRIPVRWILDQTPGWDPDGVYFIIFSGMSFSS